MQSDAIQKELLTKDGLSIARAQEVALGMEAAEANMKELKDTLSSVGDGVNLASATKAGPSKPCFRCGRKHDTRVCKFSEARCHRCGKKGHIAPVCRLPAGPAHKPPRSPPGPGHPRYYRKHKSFGGARWMVSISLLVEPGGWEQGVLRVIKT